MSIPTPTKYGGIYLSFDPRLKKKGGLLDGEGEIVGFSDSLGYSPLILILGARRAGKTPLMNVASKELSPP